MSTTAPVHEISEGIGIGHDMAQVGIGQWAVGASLVHAPSRIMPEIAPDLLEGVEEKDEAASLIVVASGKLMLSGFNTLIQSVAERLEVTPSALRESIHADKAQQVITRDFLNFYNTLLERTGRVSIGPIAPSLMFVRPIPFDTTRLLAKVLHSRKQVPFEEFIKPLSVPGWLSKRIDITKPIGDLGIKVERANNRAS